VDLVQVEMCFQQGARFGQLAQQDEIGNPDSRWSISSLPRLPPALGADQRAEGKGVHFSPMQYK
jgi:hypothetical protein